MPRSRLFVIFCILGSLVGCNNDAERITRLEKENQELKAAAVKDKTALEFELQAKCSKDAKQWFAENWGRPDKDTILLTQINHYNRGRNQCFVLVEFHYRFGNDGSWSNDMSLWDVYENSKYGQANELHTVLTVPEYKVETRVISCEVSGKQCSTLNEFNGAVQPFLLN